MPKMELKAVQNELEKGRVRPVYFLAGAERMKARELAKKIQKAALKGEAPNDFNLEKYDASETGLEAILDSAQGVSLLGGVKVILARNLEEVRNLDPLAAYLEALESTEPAAPEKGATVLILLSKSLDGRKKASKAITEHAALVPCEEVRENDREPWIEFLAKRRGTALSDAERMSLRGLEPWSLDIVDQEISKLELVGEDARLRADALRGGVSAYAQDELIDALLTRDRRRALALVHHFSGEIEVQLPFLGLLAWNFRQLKLYLLEQETRTSSSERRNPALIGKLDRWQRYWNLGNLQVFEHALFEMDFSLKNTRLTGQGLWTELILKIPAAGKGRV
jgi:DNA polymerase III delta subunit